MNYMRTADISIPYGGYLARNRTPQEIWKHSDKNNSVLWFVSHCDIDLRRQYAQVLSRYVKVDVYGQCTGKEDPCRMESDCLMEFAGKYKFYLAFENSVCKDYITEKFWEALKYGMVPIALGASIKDYEEIAPPNSFLHVDNFTSVKELGDYLKYLDTNPDVYNSYHSWRDRYEIKETGGWWWWYRGKDYESGYQGMWCKVCAAAHHKLKSPTNIGWSPEKLCSAPGPSTFKLQNVDSRER